MVATSVVIIASMSIKKNGGGREEEAHPRRCLDPYRVGGRETVDPFGCSHSISD